ncbi:hypothetical protein PMAYCL1PPCAC_10669 [Pristionchus mayeri]|uniref:G protein-coupled receptor n=1 Tax=Pristionchus mayeri TaxID=1317129 RepID=A0AAN5CEX5_9BILA|nr:hypothetical protein PMAYCL1PPCAC_10669 [Pristionchus mayeri]
MCNPYSYATGFLLNFISYCRVRTFISKTEKNKNLNRLRSYLVISAMSTVLVSIPNFIRLISVFFERIDYVITNTSNWLTAINSGMNFFVYLSLNVEFRDRCTQVLNALLRKESTGKAAVLMERSVMMTHAMMSTVTVKTLA